MFVFHFCCINSTTTYRCCCCCIFCCCCCCCLYLIFSFVVGTNMRQQQQSSSVSPTQVEVARRSRARSLEQTHNGGRPIVTPASSGHSPVGGHVLRSGVTPILRLSVDEDSQTVSVARGCRPVGESFVIKCKDTTATAVKHDEYTEVFDTNEVGLSWGEKRANDGSWQERWMQQQHQSGDEVKVFGRSSGYDASLQQRWTETWNGCNGKVEIEKECEQIEEDTSSSSSAHQEEPKPRILQRWVERTVEDGQSFSRFKDGWDYRGETPRQWMEETSGKVKKEEDNTKSSSTSSSQQHVGNINLITVGATGKTVRENYSGGDRNGGDQQEGNQLGVVGDVSEFRETLGEMTRTRKTTKRSGGSVHVEISYDDGRESWTDEWYEMVDGSKCGSKHGVNHNGDKWNEKWLEFKDGTKEVDKWAVSPHGDHLWGEKTSFTAETSEETTERWEKWISDIQLRISVDTYNTRPKGCGDNSVDKWGEKNTDTQTFKVDESGKQKLQYSQVLRDKWHDNATEYVSDKTLSDTTYDTTPQSTTMPAVTKQVKHSKHVGDRYSDGTAWGEEKSETREPSLSSGADLLRSVYEEKWWKETSGNKWGHKMYADYSPEATTTTDSKRLECHEKWYDNGLEKQTDRWEKNKDGSSAGEKSGERSCDHVTWKEKWQTDVHGNRSVLEKSWSTNEEGMTHRWGEHSGTEGRRQWLNKWTTEERHDGSGGSEGRDVWDDDGAGTSKTEQEGRQWRAGEEGMEVTNWYSNKFGGVSEKNEKWAHKEGCNEVGDRWMEKWNEMPSHKFAEKSGHNSRGDEWRETWKEEWGDEQLRKKTWAEKTGKNKQGDVWLESWVEENNKKKQARKTGANASGEQWEEEWGEDIRDDGSGEKWSRKWAGVGGDRRGESWGNKWGGDNSCCWVDKW
eukprot:GHVS01057884.1.p1 GENE.GHVS01057884.1~~GHVS01057884.1.p1  ORF type:complete len:907 (+),score=204.13 GHVS01057884.1:441-3161(+)